MQPGDIVYRQGYVVPLTERADATGPVVLPDGTDLGGLLDPTGIEGIAPFRSVADIIEGVVDGDDADGR